MSKKTSEKRVLFKAQWFDHRPTKKKTTVDPDSSELCDAVTSLMKALYELAEETGEEIPEKLHWNCRGNPVAVVEKADRLVQSIVLSLEGIYVDDENEQRSASVCRFASMLEKQLELPRNEAERIAQTLVAFLQKERC